MPADRLQPKEAVAPIRRPGVVRGRRFQRLGCHSLMVISLRSRGMDPPARRALCISGLLRHPEENAGPGISGPDGPYSPWQGNARQPAGRSVPRGGRLRRWGRAAGVRVRSPSPRPGTVGRRLGSRGGGPWGLPPPTSETGRAPAGRADTQEPSRRGGVTVMTSRSRMPALRSAEHLGTAGPPHRLLLTAWAEGVSLTETKRSRYALKARRLKMGTDMARGDGPDRGGRSRGPLRPPRRRIVAARLSPDG